jgi:hypothetical protein
LIFHDLVPELPRLRAGGTAFIPHSVRIGLGAGSYAFRDEAYVESVFFSNKSCPISYNQFEDSFTTLNTSRSEVNFFENTDKPDCALPIPNVAFTYMQLNEQCGLSVVPGENVVGLTFEPRCLIIVIAPDSRRALFDQLMAAGRPLADPIQVLVNYTLATEDDPDVESANTNCQNSRVMKENYELDKILQDEFEELRQVREKRDKTVELRDFLEYAIDNRTYLRRTHTKRFELNPFCSILVAQNASFNHLRRLLRRPRPRRRTTPRRQPPSHRPRRQSK